MHNNLLANKYYTDLWRTIQCQLTYNQLLQNNCKTKSFISVELINIINIEHKGTTILDKKNFTFSFDVSVKGEFSKKI